MPFFACWDTFLLTTAVKSGDLSYCSPPVYQTDINALINKQFPSVEPMVFFPFVCLLFFCTILCKTLWTIMSEMKPQEISIFWYFLSRPSGTSHFHHLYVWCKYWCAFVWFYPLLLPHDWLNVQGYSVNCIVILKAVCRTWLLVCLYMQFGMHDFLWVIVFSLRFSFLLAAKFAFRFPGLQSCFENSLNSGPRLLFCTLATNWKEKINPPWPFGVSQIYQLLSVLKKGSLWEDNLGSV